MDFKSKVFASRDNTPFGWGKRLSWLFGLSLIGFVSAALGVLSVVFAMVYFGDDSNLRKSAIMARINEETTIYMLDEQTQIGSIFAAAHRRYIPIDEVPAHMINAIIASEDKNFYHHHGVDPGAIFSAVIGVLKGGHMRGASTLTQQTVRNILGWWEVSLSRKFREWIAALQIERLYPKRQILEFYLNQFYVSGNGNGIGIAAKYYFNKEVRDLDLVESAFIAGSVKGPSAYDPFIKFTKESRERAIARAYERKNYVLRRMYEQGWVTEEQFKEAFEKPVKFNRGRFRSEEVALVQLIKSELNKKEILDALGIEDPRDLSNAGLKIYTTIDGDLQQSAQLAVRRNLSRVDTILQGFKTESPDRFEKRRNLVVNDFYYAQVTEIGGTKKEPEIKVNFGLPNGVIPFESLKRYAMWIDLSSGAGWQKHLDSMISQIHPGDILFIEAKSYDPETHEALCELHKRPRINGGLIAIDKGEVRTVVSGFDTKGFNRAMAARRQPGSVFKSVVYFAGLQLGWSILDRLDNERQVFPFQGRFYYPRGDHDSPYAETSMLWSGITSENLASVSLTSRLVEKLNFEQFKQLMGTMDLLPHAGEAPRDFHYRIARATGVQLDNDGVREFQLKNAINDLLLDVQYTSSFDYQSRLRKMWGGRGYVPEMQSIYAEGGDDVTPVRKTERLSLLLNNFQRLGGLDTDLVEDWKQVLQAVNDKGYEQAFQDPAIQHLLARFRVLPGAGNKPALGYGRVLESEQSQKDYSNSPNRIEIEKRLLPQGRPLNPLDMQAVWGGSALLGAADITLTDVQLDGWLPHGHFVMLKQYVDQHYNEVMARQDDYDLHRYWQHHDFRVGLGLKYLVQLTHAMGVTSKVDPVLSYPLGTNDVSAAEVAMIYQTFINGKIYRFYKEGPANQLNFLRRIEDRNGKTLYEPQRKESQLVMPEFALQMREILRRVVTHGTGRRARGEIFATLGGDGTGLLPDGKPNPSEKHIGIPAFGKTGTTNDYNNAYFAGFLPYPTQKNVPLDPENSYVIAAYVGYDMNKTMVKNFFKVSGSQGPLPAWWTFAKSIIDKKKYTDQLDDLDISLIAKGEWPVKVDTRTTPMLVDMPRGVALDRGNNDQDSFASTNIEKEGETHFDEFRANVVEAAVRVPLDDRGSPLRMFSPFKLPEEQKNDGASVTPSRVDEGQGANAASAKGAAPAADIGSGDSQFHDAAPSSAPAAGQPKASPAADGPKGAATGFVKPNEDPASAVKAALPGQVVQAAAAADEEDLFKDNGPSAKPSDPVAPKAKKAKDTDDSSFVEEELW